MPTLTDSQIAERAYNETVHPTNPQFKDIVNPTFMGNLLHEVKNAVAGNSENSPYGHAVAALVAERNIEIAIDQGLPYYDANGNFVPAKPPVHSVEVAVGAPTAIPVAPNVPVVDAAGNPLPTPRPPAVGEFPVTNFPVHADVITTQEAKGAADAAAQEKADLDAAKASDAGQV